MYNSAYLLQLQLTLLGIINVETFLQAVLAMIMLSVGLSLTKKDFQYIIQNPRITIGGLFLKMFCFPFIGVVIAILFGLSITFQLGTVAIPTSSGKDTHGIDFRGFA